jgi:outer membrane protein assembly factor BamB
VSTHRRSHSHLRAALLGVALAAALLTGCNTVDKAERPAELTKMVNRVEIRRVWRTSISGEAPKLRLGLDMAVDGNRVFIASHSGVVEAIEVSSGRRLWSQKIKAAPLSGGPGAGEGMVVVGSTKGDVIALSATDGTQRWRRHVNSEVLSAPAVGRDQVIVRGVDGRMEGLASADGAELWLVDQQVPRLSLRGDSRPLLVGDLAVCGFDNGHVEAIVSNSGAVAWNTAVDEPHGNGELQRLIDVDAPVVADGEDLFAVAYQGHVARLTRETGQILWKHEWSSYRGLGIDVNALYTTSADGVLARLDRSTGAVQWQQKTLARRELTAPAVLGGRVVVADLDGFVHWFDGTDGAYLARVSAGRGRVSNTPLVVGDLLLVFTDRGELSAYRAGATTAPAPPPQPARKKR